MDKFIGQELLSFTEEFGDHPALCVLAGAQTEDQAVDRLRQRTALEFPEQLRDLRVSDLTDFFHVVRAGGWLDDIDWGEGAVRVPQVYLSLDGRPESTEDALEFVRKLFTE
jgi:hypothetical protein